MRDLYLIIAVIVLFGSERCRSVFLSPLVLSVPAYICYGIFLFVIYQLIDIALRLRNRKPQIRLDATGVTLCNNDMQYQWNDITYAFLADTQTSSMCDGKFHIYTKSDHVTLSFDTIELAFIDLPSAIDYYSRKELSIKRYEYDSFRGIPISFDEFTRVLKLLRRFQIKTAALFFATFFPIIIFSGYVQMKTLLPFVISLGLVAGTLVMIIINKKMCRNLRNNEIMHKIQDDQYLEILQNHGVKPKPRTEKAAMLFIGVVAVVITIISMLVIDSN